MQYAADVLEPFVEDTLPVTAPLNKKTLFALLTTDAPDGIFEATVTVPYAGVCFRMGPQREGLPEGFAIWTAPQSQNGPRHVILGTLHIANGPDGLRPGFGSPTALRALEDTIGGDLHLRVVCRGQCVDVYVNDVLFLTHTYASADVPAAGGVGVFYAGAPKEFPVSWGRARRFLA